MKSWHSSTRGWSDLIIFLIMGDAKDSKARCLAQIREVGKPVMLLLNVYVGIDDCADFNMIDLEDFEYEMQDEFDMRHLVEIRQSLVAYGLRYGQNWSFIPCAYVHLKSAFMSQRKEFAKYAKKLYQLSHFDDAVHLNPRMCDTSSGSLLVPEYGSGPRFPFRRGSVFA